MKNIVPHVVSLLVLAGGVLGVAGSGSLPADECAGDAATSARCTEPGRFPGCTNGERTGTAEGTVRAGQVGMPLGDALVDLDVTYKVDVDPVERGCISRMQVMLYVSREPGASSWGSTNACIVQALFDTNGSGNGVLSDLRVYANSFCPGFLDADEGDYSMTSDVSAWFGGATHVSNGDMNDACVEEAFTMPTGPFTLRRSGDNRELQVSFEGVTLYGSYVGSGDTGARCPVVP